LIKLVMIEDGSDQAVELWNSIYPTASSILVYPEGRAALAAARRGGRLTGSDYGPAISDFQARFDDLISVGVDERLAESAGEHADAFGLRGYDAVHLASAMGLGEATLVTWDGELAEAAAATGMPVAGVETE
jgi:predicted nucleic acid-binding protein